MTGTAPPLIGSDRIQNFDQPQIDLPALHVDAHDLHAHPLPSWYTFCVFSPLNECERSRKR